MSAKRTGGVGIIKRRPCRKGSPHPTQASPGPPSPQGGGKTLFGFSDRIASSMKGPGPRQARAPSLPLRGRVSAKRTGGVGIIKRRPCRKGSPHPTQASPGPPSPQGGGKTLFGFSDRIASSMKGPGPRQARAPSLPLRGRVSAKRTGGVGIIKRRPCRKGSPHPTQAPPGPPSPQGGGKTLFELAVFRRPSAIPRRPRSPSRPSLPLRGRVSAKRTGGVEIIKRRPCRKGSPRPSRSARFGPSNGFTVQPPRGGGMKMRACSAILARWASDPSR